MATVMEPPVTEEITDPVFTVFGELVDLLLQGGTPEHVIAFRPSKAAHTRLYELMEIERNGRISPADKKELDRFMEVEHLLRMAKIRARVAIQKRDASSSEQAESLSATLLK